MSWLRKANTDNWHQAPCSMILLLLVSTLCLMLSSACAASSSEVGDGTVTALRKKIQYAASPRLAVQYCEEAISGDPQNGEYHYLLSRAYKDMAEIVATSDDERRRYDDLSKTTLERSIALGYSPQE